MIENILLVEDQSSIRSLLRGWLVESGYTVTAVKDGDEALKQIQKNSSLHIVISDIMMKNMDGIEMLKKCRQICPVLPVVLMSGYTKDENIVEALRNGACDYLIKPFEKSQLVAVINRAENLILSKIEKSTFQKFVNNLRIDFCMRSQDLSLEMLQECIRETLTNYTALPNKDLLNFSMVLEEAVLNAHEHGNLELESEWKDVYPSGESRTLFEKRKEERLSLPNYAGRKIRVELAISREKVEVSIEDEGKGYPAGGIASEAAGTPYGMGLMIINNLMDEINFNKTGNRIILVKYLNGSRS